MRRRLDSAYVDALLILGGTYAGCILAWVIFARIFEAIR